MAIFPAGGIAGLLGSASPYGAPLRQVAPTADQAVNQVVGSVQPTAPATETPAFGTRIMDPETGREFTVGGAMTQDFNTGLAYQRALEAYDPSAPVEQPSFRNELEAQPQSFVNIPSQLFPAGPSGPINTIQQRAMQEASLSNLFGPQGIDQGAFQSTFGPPRGNAMGLPQQLPPNNYPGYGGGATGGGSGLMAEIPKAIAPVIQNASQSLNTGIGQIISKTLGTGGPSSGSNTALNNNIGSLRSIPNMQNLLLGKLF